MAIDGQTNKVIFIYIVRSIRYKLLGCCTTMFYKTLKFYVHPLFIPSLNIFNFIMRTYIYGNDHLSR